MEGKNLLLSAAMAGILLGAAGCASSGQQAGRSTASERMMNEGKCFGVNSCKGQGACGGNGHSCAGKNACKGEGWVKTSKERCYEEGGNFES